MATALAAFDARPYFERALHFGVRQGLISTERLAVIEADIAKGVVQIANYFGTAHLRPELESALGRMVHLMSLYLEDTSDGELRVAAVSLRDKTLLSHSKGGSDMLKRLQALPVDPTLPPQAVTAEQQRDWLDARTGAQAMSLAAYRAELAARQGHRDTLDFAHWLARSMGAAAADVDQAEAVIRSAMLVLFVKKAALQLPTRTGFVNLIAAAARPRASLDEARFETFIAAMTPAFQALARQAMAQFLSEDLPCIRAAGNTADRLLDGDHARPWFVRESLDEVVGAYDRLVAKEWHRVTRGEADDPRVLATLFLRLATGLEPGATLLLKEAKALTGRFRGQVFDP